MAHESKPYRASHYSALPASAALALAILVQASPARSETLDLACATAEHDYNARIQIDTDSKIATVSPDETPYAITGVTDQFIKFEKLHSPGIFLKGVVDRSAGTATLTEESDRQFVFRTTHLVCRRATMKF
ncbi:MAG: hypothetical protein PSX71_08505 [bacterium]|nr:hypothetical protein [bacterium]